MAEENASTQNQTREEYIESKLKGHSQFYKKIYRMIYTINDFIIGLWFLIGSILFYFPEPVKVWGITLFVLGSVQLLIRPTIRIFHEAHARNHYGEEYDKNQ